MAMSNAKQNIIDATVRVLKNQSIKDITMRNIAKEAGVTTGSIYHHYKNKEELLLDVMQESLHFTTKLYEQIQQDGYQKNNEELLIEINQEVGKRIRKVERQKLHIQFFSYMMKRKMDVKGTYHDNYQQLIDSTANLMMKAYDVEDCHEKHILASMLVAAIDGVAMQQIIDVLPEDLETYIDVFTDFFTSSLREYLKKEM